MSLDFCSLTSTKIINHDRLNAETEVRIQLSSIKPDVKEIANLKQCHSSITTHVLEKYIVFKKMLFMLPHNGFIIELNIF